MHDLIPPYDSLCDVRPGDPWQPEPAARYNAVNELLRQEHAPPPPPGHCCSSDMLLYVCNVSEKMLPVNSPVQIDSSFVPDDTYRLSLRNMTGCGKPVENQHSFWGVALENIYPGHAGTVQVAGIVLLPAVKGIYEKEFEGRKVRNDFVFPGLDGQYHFGKRGGAEVIWYDRHSGFALVRLGARDHQYTGMFAVLENGDGTFTVKGGETDLYPTYTTGSFYRGDAFINDTVIPIEGSRSEGRQIVLAARYDPQKGEWALSVVSGEGNLKDLYIPGEQIYWELARYSGIDEEGYPVDFQQLWQGGRINFRDRYFIL